MPGNPTPPTPVSPTPWKPADLPTLRAAYSDRTAALMAYLAAFAYDTQIQAKGVLQVAGARGARIQQIDFVSQRHDRWLGLYRGGGGPHRAGVSRDVFDQKLGYRF